MIETYLRLLTLNMILMAQMFICSGGLKQFLDMRFRRRISFSKKVATKEVSKVDLYELDKNEKKHDISFQIIEDPDDDTKIFGEEGSKSDSWDERSAVSFSYDKEENFS